MVWETVLRTIMGPCRGQRRGSKACTGAHRAARNVRRRQHRPVFRDTRRVWGPQGYVPLGTWVHPELFSES